MELMLRLRCVLDAPIHRDFYLPDSELNFSKNLKPSRLKSMLPRPLTITR